MGLFAVVRGLQVLFLAVLQFFRPVLVERMGPGIVQVWVRGRERERGKVEREQQVVRVLEQALHRAWVRAPLPAWRLQQEGALHRVSFSGQPIHEKAPIGRTSLCTAWVLPRYQLACSSLVYFQRVLRWD